MEAGADIVGYRLRTHGPEQRGDRRYFERLEQDLDGDSEHAEAMVRYDIDMRFTPGDPGVQRARVRGHRPAHLRPPVNIQAGEFIYLWIPGLGEKPFSALVDDPSPSWSSTSGSSPTH
jgi:hypothetical protein